ncbi:MAG: phospholipase D-like domain-containing protein [Candidatus Heimdallarchaeaceae archaeon]
MTTNVIYASEIFNAIQKLIEYSEKEIILLSPWFDLQGHIMDSLANRLRAGVKVSIVTREPNNKKHRDAIQTLKKLGANIFYDDLLHAKLLLSDRNFAVLGSANLQERAMQRNHELAIYTENLERIYEVIDFISYLEGVLGVEIFEYADKMFDNPITKILKKIGEKLRKEEVTVKACPKCGGKLIVREGKRGLFYGCSNFPNCKYTEDYNNRNTMHVQKK